jgi:hypothetical protein
MKKLLFLLLWIPAVAVRAQVLVDVTLGTSKSDYSYGTLGVSWQPSDTWRLGASVQNSDYRYRFIDARQVSNGYAGTVRLLAAARIAENENLRFDFFVKPGVRFILAPDEAQKIENYSFENSTALVLDPGFLVTLKYWDKLWLHTGVNLHMAAQIRPEFIFEQYPSGYLVAGGSYALGEKWTLMAQGTAGPTVGAGGDTEKFFWQTSIGLRYSLNGNRVSNLLYGF